MLKGLSGAKWRATHQSSVDGMLHDLNVRRPVKSYGSGFSNRDRWTGRGLFTAMNRYDGESWSLNWSLREANAEIPVVTQIVMAATPDDLPAGTALALVGGAYHEAWHTRYSRRTTLRLEEIEAPLNERWGKADVKFWKGQHGVMLTWSNIIEDIRIERLGCARFPGALPKMEALQDLILKMEQEGFEKQMPENLLLTMIGCAFRDIGLGYDTPRQQIALAFYERVCPEAVAFVNGPLRPMLDKAINLSESADMEPIWMAMDIALLLRDLAEEQPQDAEDESEDESEGGDGGAPDADQDESEDDSEGAGGGAPKPEQGDESKPEKGGGKGKPEKGEQGDESEGGASKPEQGEGDSDDGDSDDGDSDDGDADDGDSNDGENAGGQSVLNDDQIRELAAALIESIANEAKMDVKDVSQALEQAINAAFNQDVEQGEMPWRSPCPEEDKVAYANVRDSKAGFAVRNKVRNEIAALRARLRNKFLAARTPSYTHGVRKGVDMSERRMVDSIIEINMGMEPTRPDYQKDKKNDCSLAVALVIDESGSMSGLRKDTVKGAVAIADALSSLGCPVLAIGPRNHSGYCAENASGCHRYQPVRIDVFKDWNESMTTALPRFPSITATGGTPLEDGIQYALQELNKRPERHRIVLTITDGVPDNPQVVRNQIRVSADAQIKIVGIGLGYAGESVGNLFPEHLSVPQIENLPAMLASYLEGVMFPSRAKKIDGVAKSFKAA